DPGPQVSIGSSQPLEAIPSQSANPLKHAAIWQVPLGQVAEAFARLQAALQDPQSDTVRRERSHPSLVTPLQFPQPALQLLIAQAPLVQRLDAFASAHEFPHWPQLFTSVEVLRHTPEQQALLRHSGGLAHDWPSFFRQVN